MCIRDSRSITLSFALILPDEAFLYYSQGMYDTYVNAVLSEQALDGNSLMTAYLDLNEKLDETGIEYESYLQNIGRQLFYTCLLYTSCVGHAPKKCKICGKWFLTTNARHTKYCGGYAPGDKLHRTCRQIGNLKGREQRELADDHPVKQIYEKRLNTINRYVKRGTLDADLAEVMKKLAKDKMLRALSNVAYAKGDYEKEVGQAALKKEAKLRTK